MNGRILELAKNPELFQIKDLELLSGEINKHPYIQSLRALHLLGTHRLQPENYANELSITAAYTTDKKILYQLINSKEETKQEVKSSLKKIVEEPVVSQESTNNFTKIEAAVIDAPKPVFVNGELNRILFEGEEDFLDQESETIDIESTIESGQIVTQKPDSVIVIEKSPEFTEANDAENFSTEEIVKEENISEEKELIENPADLSFHETADFLPEVKVETTSENIESEKTPKFTESNDAETFSKEKIVNEDFISLEKPIIEDASEVSFHATTDFLPEVKIASNPEKAEVQEMPKPVLNKHEEEMKRLIAEVEAKIKASKKQKPTSTEKEETAKSAEVNFSETQSFEISKIKEAKTEITELETITEKEKVIIAEKPEDKVTEIKLEQTEIKAESIQETRSDWKPMSFSTNTPDALIDKKQGVQTQKTSINKEKKETVKEETPATERPIFNVSFFTQKVSALNKEEEIKEASEDEKNAEKIEESNVPDFINTWQSWLKIDRTKEETKEKIEISITEIKNKVIENFIEKEPRISKLKEESDFVIKERNDDISHLMTETLANLYIEQKLYAKAIKAFGILSEKHPDKKSYFNDKIKEVKELRQNK